METRESYLTKMPSDFFLFCKGKKMTSQKIFPEILFVITKSFFFKYCSRDRYYKNNQRTLV